MKKMLITAVIVILAGCTTSRITSSWKAKDLIPLKYTRVMVIGLMKDTDALLRSEMEAHLVGDLNNAGFNAFSAFAEFGPKAFSGSTEKELLDKINNKGFDAVITVVLLNKAQEKEYMPGRVVYSPYYIHQGRFWNYYNTMYMRIESEGYYATHTRYFWESNLYNMAAKKLVYSVQTQSFDPTATRSMAHEYGKLIVNDMLKNKILDTAMVVR